MIDINDYIKLPLETRQKHLDLSAPCIERGGFSTKFCGVLVAFLDTTFPSGMKIHLCHKCYNGKCSNPKHMYFGTAKENVADNIDNGTYVNGYEALIRTYGKEEADKIVRKNLVDNRDMSIYKRGYHGRFVKTKNGPVA